MKIICGGSTGIIKVVSMERQEVVQKWGGEAPATSRAVTHMAWAHSGPAQEAEICVAYKDGSVEGYFPSTGQMRYHLARRDSAAPSAPTVGLHSEEFEGKRNVFLCAEDGTAQVHRFDLTGQAIASLQDEDMEEDGAEGNARGRAGLEEMQKRRSVRCDQTQFAVKGKHVGCMRVVRVDNAVVNMACSGRDNLLRVYDVEKQMPIFRAKNKPADYLGIPPSVWDRDITYMNAGQPNPNLVATCTAYQDVRLYDLRSKRLPVYEKKFDDYKGGHSLTCIAPSYNSDAEIFVGNAIGRAARYSFHTGFGGEPTFALFKNMAGSIRQMQQHPKDHRFVSIIGADRYVRVYDYKTRHLLHQMFLVEMQQAMLFTSEAEIDSNDDKGSDKDEEGRYADDVHDVEEAEEEYMEDSEDNVQHAISSSDEEEEDEIFGDMKIVQHKDKKAGTQSRSVNNNTDTRGTKTKKRASSSSRRGGGGGGSSSSRAVLMSSPSTTLTKSAVEIIDGSHVTNKIRKIRKFHRMLKTPMPLEIANPLMKANIEKEMKTMREKNYR